jgi:hypothetical protein
LGANLIPESRTEFREDGFRFLYFLWRNNVDRDEDEQSSLGNDAELDREKNKVTGVKTTDQPPERKDLNDAGGRQKERN